VSKVCAASNVFVYAHALELRRMHINVVQDTNMLQVKGSVLHILY
jgi:hypothetical protein